MGYIMIYLRPKATNIEIRNDWLRSMGFFEALMIINCCAWQEGYERHFRKYN